MAKDTIKHAVEIQTGVIPLSITTGTTETSGWYVSDITRVSFPTAFSRPPKVMIQENSGNPNRFFRYRIIEVTSTYFAVMLSANEPNYCSEGSQWIAIAE